MFVRAPLTHLGRITLKVVYDHRYDVVVHERQRHDRDCGRYCGPVGPRQYRQIQVRARHSHKGLRCGRWGPVMGRREGRRDVIARQAPVLRFFTGSPFCNPSRMAAGVQRPAQPMLCTMRPGNHRHRHHPHLVRSAPMRAPHPLWSYNQEGRVDGPAPRPVPSPVCRVAGAQASANMYPVARARTTKAVAARPSSTPLMRSNWRGVEA
jgi:hypothetical protein